MTKIYVLVYDDCGNGNDEYQILKAYVDKKKADRVLDRFRKWCRNKLSRLSIEDGYFSYKYHYGDFWLHTINLDSSNRIKLCKWVAKQHYYKEE